MQLHDDASTVQRWKPLADDDPFASWELPSPWLFGWWLAWTLRNHTFYQISGSVASHGELVTERFLDSPTEWALVSPDGVTAKFHQNWGENNTNSFKFFHKTKKEYLVQFSSFAQSCLTLQPLGLQHTRLPCPSPTPGACSNSCPLSRWCHSTNSSSVVPFSLILPNSFYKDIKPWYKNQIYYEKTTNQCPS